MGNSTSSPQKIGLWTSTSLVIGNMIGAGVFLMPAALATYGGISLFGWLFSAAGSILLAGVFSKLSKLLPNVNGGPYAYTKRGFGDFTGFLVAWGYWISVCCANAAITVSLVGSMSVFCPLLATNSIVAVLTGLQVLWFLTWINTRGVVASGIVQFITTVLKLAPLLFIAIGGVFFIKFANFIPFNISGVSNFSAITATAAMTLYAFLGVECATIPAGSVEKPEKTIPRATMLGTLITTLVYVLGTMSVMGVIPAKDLQHSVTPFADAAVIIWGENARYWVGAGVAIAAFGALNGWILIQGQIPYAVAKDKLFPAILGKENKEGAPGPGIIISSVLVSVFMYMNYSKGLVDQFKFLIMLSTLTTIIPYLFSAAAYIIISMESSNIKKISWAGVIIMAALAFAYSLWAMAGLGEETVYWGFILLICGTPFYVLILWRNKKNT